MKNATRRSAIKTLSTAAITMSIPENQLLAGNSNTGKLPFLVRENEGRFKEEYHFWGMDLYLKISGKDMNEQMSIFYGAYHKNDGPPLHVHHNQDEVFYITEGIFLIQVGYNKHTLKAGDTIFLPKNVPHTFLVLSEIAKMIFLTQPSGKIEGLFKALAGLPPSATPELIQKIHKEHLLSIVGPRLIEP